MTAQEQPPYYDVAISFAEEQRDIALAISLAAKAAGLHCYYYPDSGKTVGRVITAEIAEVYGAHARCAIIILSREYLQKPFAQAEADILVKRRAAKGDSFPLIPIRTDETLPEDIGLPEGTVYVPWNHNPSDMAELVKANVSSEAFDKQEPPTSHPSEKPTFSVKAKSIKTNVSAGEVKGDLNIN